MVEKLKTIPSSFYWIAVILLTLGGTQLWKWYHPAEQASTRPGIMAEAPKAIDVPKVTIPGPRTIVVYQKEKLAKKIDLPPQLINNPAEKPIATALVLPSPYGGVAVAFLNTSTGASVISYQAKKKPFFEVKSDLELSGDYGYSSKGQVIAASARYTPLRIGPANLHIRGEAGVNANQFDGRATVGIHGNFDLFR